MSSKVYIMSNKAMPGLVKIGWTSKNDVEQRRKELSNTSVPYPFVVEATYDVYVDSADKIIHEWFPRELRVNDNREFFNITVDYAKKVIEDYRNKGRLFWHVDDEDEDVPDEDNFNGNQSCGVKKQKCHLSDLEPLYGKKFTTLKCCNVKTPATVIVKGDQLEYNGNLYFPCGLLKLLGAGGGYWSNPWRFFETNDGVKIVDLHKKWAKQHEKARNTIGVKLISECNCPKGTKFYLSDKFKNGKSISDYAVLVSDKMFEYNGKQMGLDELRKTIANKYGLSLMNKFESFCTSDGHTIQEIQQGFLYSNGK